jgi:hypothetical protein
MEPDNQTKAPSTYRLDGWKEIAKFLDIKDRTARNWERDRDLPVHRFTDSDKSRVWANRDELTIWRAERDSRTQPGTGEVEALQEPAEIPPELVYTSRHKHWAWILIGAVAAAGIGIGSIRLLMPRGPVSGIRVTQNTLAALGPDGQEIWCHVFPLLLEETAYTAHPEPGVTWALSHPREHGEPQTLFAEAAPHELPHRLLAFDPAGRIAWEFRPDRRVFDLRNREYTPPYSIHRLAVISAKNHTSEKVIVSSLHHWSFPSQVAVLDSATGHLLSEYWHRGHLSHILVTDLDGDGEPEVILGGVNDAPEYATATLVVFDHRRISGASTGRDGSPQFQGMTPGSEKATVRFPRTPLSQGLEFNRVSDVSEKGGRIVVVVAEGTAEADPSVIYELDRALRPINVGLSEAFSDRYFPMRVKDPKLPSPQDLVEQLKRDVAVWWRP